MVVSDVRRACIGAPSAAEKKRAMPANAAMRQRMLAVGVDPVWSVGGNGRGFEGFGAGGNVNQKKVGLPDQTMWKHVASSSLNRLLTQKLPKAVSLKRSGDNDRKKHVGSEVLGPT